MTRPRSSLRENRSFGLVVGAIFAVLGLWWLYRGRFAAARPVVLTLGAVLILTALVAPRLLETPRRLWMSFGEGLSFVMTRVVLGVVFFLVVAPVGWIRRMTGGDPLRRRRGKGESYWIPYPQRQRDTKHYEKMY
jgi:hypothetical protein